MLYRLIAKALLIVAMVQATSGSFAQEIDAGIKVENERVYANVETTGIVELLLDLTAAAGIGLNLSSDIRGEAELYARGVPLGRVVDHMLPEGSGFALKLGPQGEIRELVVFSSEDSQVGPRPSSGHQRYLARQVGKRDDDTAEIMREALADRSESDTRAKLIAIEQLADMNSDKALSSLEAGMGDPDPEVRLSTARTLYRLQGDDAITLIGQIYYAADSSEMRREVAKLIRGSSHPLAQGLMRENGLQPLDSNSVP